MTHPYLEDFLRQCKTDRELKGAIRDLKQALAHRQARRRYNQVLEVLAPLGTPERAVLLTLHDNHLAPIEDPGALQKLVNARLIVMPGSLTMLGRHAATVLKQRQTKVEVL
jgi:hypothetical protein